MADVVGEFKDPEVLEELVGHDVHGVGQIDDLRLDPAAAHRLGGDVAADRLGADLKRGEFDGRGFLRRCRRGLGKARQRDQQGGGE